MVKSEMVYNLDDMKAFFKDYSAKKFFTTMGIVYLILGILIVLVINNLAFLKEDRIFYTCLFIVVYIAVLTFCMVKAVKDTPEKMLKSIKSLYGDGTAVYEFDENTFKNSIVSGKTKSEAVIEYSKLSKAIESKTHFYIFTNENTAYVIRKTAFTEGTPEELRNILKTRFGERFIVKKGVLL